MSGSSSRSMRSRAVSLPRERCFSSAFSPPPRATCAVRSRSSATSASIRARRSSKASEASDLRAQHGHRVNSKAGVVPRRPGSYNAPTVSERHGWSRRPAPDDAGAVPALSSPKRPSIARAIDREGRAEMVVRVSVVDAEAGRGADAAHPAARSTSQDVNFEHAASSAFGSTWSKTPTRRSSRCSTCSRAGWARVVTRRRASRSTTTATCSALLASLFRGQDTRRRSRPCQPSESHVEREARPRLVFFFTKASGRSRRVEGYLSQVLQRRGNHESFELLNVDVDENADLAAALRDRRGADDRRRRGEARPRPTREPARLPRHRAAARSLAALSAACPFSSTTIRSGAEPRPT